MKTIILALALCATTLASTALAGDKVANGSQGKAHDHEDSDNQFATFHTQTTGGFDWLIFHVEGELVWCQWQGDELRTYVVVGGSFDGVEFEVFAPGSHGTEYDFFADGGPVEEGHLDVQAAPTNP